MEIWKIIHVSCACLSVSGFVLRGFWMLSDSAWFTHKLSKILPHIIDSLLLFSAIMLLLSWHLNPIEHSWIIAKIIALLLYIFFGLVAFRFGKNKQQRALAWLGALLCAAYIVQTALTKNPWVFF